MRILVSTDGPVNTQNNSHCDKAALNPGPNATILTYRELYIKYRELYIKAKASLGLT